KPRYLLANAYRASQRENEALLIYRQVAELLPKDPQPLFGAGTILLAQGRQLEARKAFEKSVEISADYLPAMQGLVNLDLADKRYAGALDRVQKQIEKNAKLAQLWGLRGKIHLAQHDFARAEADLLKAID